MNMLSYLCNDINALIAKYVFYAHYRDVQKQYRERFLYCADDQTKERICWSHIDSKFVKMRSYRFPISPYDCVTGCYAQNLFCPKAYCPGYTFVTRNIYTGKITFGRK